MLRSFYENKMYGKWRSGEKVSYSVIERAPRIVKKPEGPGFFFPTDFEDADKIRLSISRNLSDGSKKTASFDINLFIPKPENRFLPDGKCPIIVCMHPILCKDYALSKGYALVFLNPGSIASDDINHNGAFYELYPYTSNPKDQTGDLMAWGWGASKVLDALEAGLADEYKIDTAGTIVTGVSRYGKATAVCGAFEPRFALTAPACSGAGGLALYSYVSEGMTFDFTEIGGPKDYTYTKNEPLSCLQSDAERGWFNDAFLDFKEPGAITQDQEGLVELAMSKNRFYFVIASYMSEDWVNAPAMWECYKRALKTYEENGLRDNLVCHFHKEGHAVIEEDLQLLIPYFNKMHYGMQEDVDFETLHKTVFK